MDTIHYRSCGPILPARLVAVIFAIILTPSAFAESASTLYKRGQEEEARRNYLEAYAAYQRAQQLKPKQLEYRMAAIRTRLLAGEVRIHRAQELRDKGNLEEALKEFQAAATIDTASFTAQQEIRRTQVMIEAARSGMAITDSAHPHLDPRVEHASGPVTLAPISTVPITLRLSEDSKLVYETICKLAGVNVLFDSDYVSRRVNVELNAVTLDEALRVLGIQSNTFWRPVTPNTIFVSVDNATKRKQLEQNVVRTFYLANYSQPTDLQEVVTTLRTVLEISRLTQVQSQGAVVVRGTPDQVALAEKLIDDLDKAKPEVVVEVAVMQVSRDKVRKMGISPPTGGKVTLKDNLSTSSDNSDKSGDTSINMNRLGNLTAKDFQVTLPAISANMLFTDGNAKLIQNPQIRAVDGQKAVLKIGERIPVAMGSYSAGVATAISALVNTQFQYQDIGVNIEITPRVHGGGEVTLKMSLEVSAVDRNTTIGDIDEPVIGQRKIEHEIRLKEGEVNILGGILEDQDIKNLSGYPGLMKIPILKYLFGSESTEQKQNEIIFAIVPHVVRRQELTPSNLRTIDVGNGNTIQLRQANPELVSQKQ